VSKGDVYETDLLKLIFNATPIPNLADNTATAAATTLTIALHTADPGEAGTQATSETTYTGYVRQTRARSAAGWTVANGVASPVADIDFPECTAVPGGPITHFSIGTGVSSKLLYSGPMNPNVTMAVGVIPRIKATSTVSED